MSQGTVAAYKEAIYLIVFRVARAYVLHLIVASRSLTLYIGVTSEIEARVAQQKAGAFEGFSAKYKCSRLVLFERHPFVEDAIAREKQLKGWSRKKKIWLVERENPASADLSEEWGMPMKMFRE